MKTTLVPTKETCLALREAGFDIDTEFYWISPHDGSEPRVDKYYVDEPETNLPAPLLSELLEVMPGQLPDSLHRLRLEKNSFGYQCLYSFIDGRSIRPDKPSQKENPAEAAAQLMLFLIREGHYDPEE